MHAAWCSVPYLAVEEDPTPLPSSPMPSAYLKLDCRIAIFIFTF